MVCEYFETIFFFAESQAFVPCSSKYMAKYCCNKTCDKSVVFALNLGQEYLMFFWKISMLSILFDYYCTCKCLTHIL